MFYLSEIEHTLRMPPHLLNLPLKDAVKKELERLFLDKVIPKLGLCVSAYDIRSIDGGFIQPGDGAATYVVSFRLLMLRPFVGEVIVAKLKESNANGLRLSLGFFDDIYVPLHLLPEPCHSEPDPNNVKRIRWVWQYKKYYPIDGVDNYPTDGIGDYPIDGVDETRCRVETVNYPIDGVDEIRFRVDSVNYSSPPIQQELDKQLDPSNPNEKKNVEQPKSFAPMVIHASLDGDGLGPISWWV